MEEINGFNIAVKVLGEKIAQLESELRVERYYKEDYKSKLDKIEEEYISIERKYNALVDKLNEYCAGGNK